MSPDKQQEIAQRIAELVSGSAYTLFFIRLMESHKGDPDELSAEYETWLAGEVVKILQEEN